MTSELLDLWDFLFVSEQGKFNVDFKNAREMSEKCYGFSDNLISIGNFKFSLLQREYSQLVLNVLSSSPKISDLMKKKFFQLNFAKNDKKVG